MSNTYCRMVGHSYTPSFVIRVVSDTQIGWTDFFGTLKTRKIGESQGRGRSRERDH